MKGDWFWHVAYLYLDPEHLLKVDYPESHLFSQGARSLLSLQPGNTPDEVLRWLQPVPTIYSDAFWAPGLTSIDIIIRHVIPSLLGDDDVLQKALKTILAECRYLDKQKLYYGAAFLAGEIGFDDWLRQPYQENIKSRAMFIRPLKDDLYGRPRDARKGYQTLIENSIIYGPENLYPYRFAEWRLRSLAEV